MNNTLLILLEKLLDSCYYRDLVFCPRTGNQDELGVKQLTLEL